MLKVPTLPFLVALLLMVKKFTLISLEMVAPNRILLDGVLSNILKHYPRSVSVDSKVVSKITEDEDHLCLDIFWLFSMIAEDFTILSILFM